MTSTFERRKLEIFFAMLTTGFGAWLLFPSAMSRGDAYGWTISSANMEQYDGD